MNVRFFKLKRGVIINILNIISITKDSIYMVDGYNYDISFDEYQVLLDYISSYLWKMP